jgi:hypothetical protein
MVKRGVGPGEGYAKGREDQILNDARQSTGALGSVTELVGGGLPEAARSAVSAFRLLSSAPSFAGRTLATAADAAGLRFLLITTASW